MAITPWISFSNATTPYRLKKEVLRTGFWTDGNKDQFNIDLALMEHLQREHREMMADKVETPIVLSHDGTSKFGNVWDLEIEADTVDGKLVHKLVAVCDFKDEASLAEAKRNDVSVYIPPKRMTGVGKERLRVLHHIALTPWPVVPGLADWAAVAASFAIAKEIPKVETLLDDLAALFEVEIAEDASEETIAALILAAAKKFKAELDELKGKGDDKKDDEKPEEKPPAIAASFNPGAGLVNTVKKAREQQINALVGTCITAAVAKELKDEYCGDKAIQFALSDEKGDDFDKLIERLSKNKLSSGTREGAVAFAMPHSGGAGQPLSPKEDAKRRQELAAKK